jgi:hypothetical protein
MSGSCSEATSLIAGRGAPSAMADVSEARSRRNDAFLRAWTCKEAFAKAGDLGIAAGLDVPTLSRDAANGQPIVFRETPSQGGTWYLYDLDTIPGHVGALAVSGRRARIPWRSC